MNHGTSSSTKRSPFHYILSGLLALWLLGLLAPRAATAQQAAVGLKGGVAQSTFVGEDADADSRTGFRGGVYFRYDVNSALSIQPEVMYTFKGADTEEGDLSAPLLRTLSGEYTIQYLEFPILFKLNAPLGEVFHASLYAGPQLGFKTEDKLNGRRINDFINNTNTVSPLEFSGLVGGDLGINLEPFDLGPLSRVVVDGRYTLGLTNTFQVSDTSPSIQNATFSGTLGVEFSI